MVALSPPLAQRNGPSRRAPKDTHQTLLWKFQKTMLRNWTHYSKRLIIMMMSKKPTTTPPSAGRVIAIDPGYDRCGVAIIERTGGKDTLLYSECITTDKKQLFPERLATVGSEIVRLIARHQPTALSIEHLYFTNNQKTAMHVAEVRGALIFIAASLKIPVYEYTPSQVKVAVAGSGRADKKQMMLIIPKLIRVTKTIKHDDEYDAIALGITHLATHRTPQKPIAAR